MPGILRFLHGPGFRFHGRFGFREHPTESDADLLNGEFIAFVDNDDVAAASELSMRLQAGEPIVPLEFIEDLPPRPRRVSRRRRT